jgi:hypothetical protein
MALMRTKSTMAAKITAGWPTDETYSHATIHATFTAGSYSRLHIGRDTGASPLPRDHNAGNPLSQSEMLR